MNKYFVILLAACAVFLLASCGPPDGYDAAKTAALNAQADAAANQAKELCPNEWKSAEDVMAKANAEDAAKDWKAAMADYQKAKELYDVAKLCAIKKKEAMNVPPPPPPPPPAPPPAYVKAVVEPPIFFDYNKFAIRKDQTNAAKAAADLLKGKFADRKFQLVGWCDIRGTEEYNLALGERRANTVYQYLTANGVAAAKLEKKSGGATTKFSAEKTDAGYQLNRRVEFADMGK